jgi:hypothetical protein
MSGVVLPRLDRASALEVLEQHRLSSPPEIAAAMPETGRILTYSPVGGQRVNPATLNALRTELLSVARAHGMPDPINATSEWEAKSARVIRARLDMTAHEASHDEIWSYLTCCWLLDIALWRFGTEASVDRFVGHLNRNTFRRMWWRAEVLGPDVDLALLGEDELVNIMERPTLFSDRRLARAIALELIDRVMRGEAVERMRLMREATKRLLRLTPFIAFPALGGEQVRLVVADAFDAAASGLAGRSATMPHRVSDSAPMTSPEVRDLGGMEIATPTEEPPQSLEEAAHADNFDEVALAAVGIARRAGRVTNTSLREVVPYITAEEARDVFRVLIERGELVRRGVKRGTHYLIPEEAGTEHDLGWPSPSLEPAEPERPRPVSPRPPAPLRVPPPRPRLSETALRRLLRRVR